MVAGASVYDTGGFSSVPMAILLCTAQSIRSKVPLEHIRLFNFQFFGTQLLAFQ